MNKIYFITLTPYQLYFFGGEREERADYYLKGNYWPQQTALLGMIRYQILKQNGLLENNKIKNDIEASKWIGKKSFQYNEKKQTFGKIDAISPCYIVKQTANDLKKYLSTYPEYINELKLLGENYFLLCYDHKTDYSIRWKNVDDENDILCYRRTNERHQRHGENVDNNDILSNNKIFEEIERVGVDKNYDGQTDNDSFYKQVWYRMKKNFAFGFYLTVADDVKIEDADVPLGKENSAFRMKVIKEVIPKKTLNEQGNAIVLTSDAYVNVSFLEYCKFAVCATIPFRNLINITDSTYNYCGLHKSESRIQLLQRGSTFLAEDIRMLTKILKEETNFRKIGYNSFQIIQINLK